MKSLLTKHTLIETDFHLMYLQIDLKLCSWHVPHKRCDVGVLKCFTVLQ